MLYMHFCYSIKCLVFAHMCFWIFVFVFVHTFLMFDFYNVSMLTVQNGSNILTARKFAVAASFQCATGTGCQKIDGSCVLPVCQRNRLPENWWRLRPSSVPQGGAVRKFAVAASFQCATGRGCQKICGSCVLMY